MPDNWLNWDVFIALTNAKPLWCDDLQQTQTLFNVSQTSPFSAEQNSYILFSSVNKVRGSVEVCVHVCV